MPLIHQFPFGFWKSAAIPDPTTFAGFTAQYQKPDYTDSAGGSWLPHASTIGPVLGRFSNGGATPPVSSGGEPLFVGPDGHFDALLSLAAWSDFFSATNGYTCITGFVSTASRSPAAASYDNPQIVTEAGGYWGISYSNRINCWHYAGAYTPGISLPLAINTPTVCSMRFNPAAAAAQQLQARRMKDPWTDFGSSPGPPASTTGQILMGQNYAEAINLVGSVRFLLTYNQPLSDSDADKAVDWATGTWPGYFS